MLRSATLRFSWGFSSSNSFSRQTLVAVSAPYFDFQR